MSNVVSGIGKEDTKGGGRINNKGSERKIR
jgi:hypothetical protein